MTTSYVVFDGGSDLDDPLILHVQSYGTAHAAVRANGIRRSLPRLVPGAPAPHLIFAGKHQGPGGAHADAVPTVNARGFRKRHSVLGGNAGVKTPARDADGECVLRVSAARFHTLIAKHALTVVADIEIVVSLNGLCDSRRA